jgi:hypothetical protein
LFVCLLDVWLDLQDGVLINQRLLLDGSQPLRSLRAVDFLADCYLPNIACNLGTVDTTKMPVCPSCFSVLTDSIILNIRRGAGISLAFAFTEVSIYSLV